MLYPQDENFSMDVAVKGNQTLWDLHEALIKKLNYDPGQTASFLMVSEDDWSIRKEYSSINFENPADESPMKRITITDVISRKKQKLMYLFDMFSERFFIFEFVSEYEENKDMEYPILFNEKGQTPDQTFYDFDIEKENHQNAEDDDEDEFGFNDDDMYGFDENELY